MLVSPIRCSPLKELATNIRMEELIEPTTLADIQNALCKTFEDYVRKVNPKGDGEKVYTHEVMRIIPEIFHT